MPKVPEGYEQRKRESILDAAEVLCESKPAYEITMRDVIRQTKLSPGSVYRHFSDIDDVLISLMNRIDGKFKMWEQIEPVFSSDESVPQVLFAVFAQLGAYLRDSLAGGGKISFELNTKMVTDLEFFQKVQERSTEVNDYALLMQRSMEYLAQKVGDATLKPLIPLEDIFSFAVVSMDGIVRDLILTRCYKLPAEAPGLSLDEMKLTHTLARSLLLMLGVDPKELNMNEGVWT